MRVATFVYGLICYAIFFLTFLYLIGFVGNWVVPKSIDRGGVSDGPVWLAIIINSIPLAAFAIQHTVMARPAFKEWWTRYIPQPMERSTFVLVSCLILIVMVIVWRPMTDWSLWTVEAPLGRAILAGISLSGWAIVLFSSFLIDHFELFGLRQVTLRLLGRDYEPPRFVERSFYRVIRHPLMVGFMIAFWATPEMTAGHLLFAGLTTGYILFGVQIEERTLVALHGESYLEYRKRAGMFLPKVWAARRSPASVGVDGRSGGG